MMKKVIAVFLLLVVLLGTASLLTACGHTGNCEECGQTAKLSKFKFRDGTVEWLCDDCTKIAKFFAAW